MTQSIKNYYGKSSNKIYGVLPEETIIVLKKLHTNVKYLLYVGEEKVKIEATVGLIQSNNLGPIFFICLNQAVATTLSRQRDGQNEYQTRFNKPTLDVTKGKKTV